MANSPSADATTKARIIAHMNKDHQDSLALYLEHYLSIPSHLASRARLTDISLSTLHLTTDPASFTSSTPKESLPLYVIPIDPPMASFAQARERVVAMDNACRTALDRDAMTLRKYIPPRGVEAAVFGICLFTFLLLHRRAHLAPGSRLAGVAPGLARMLWRVQPWVFWGMVGIHGAEAWTMQKGRLRRFNVRKGSGVWWAWTASCFVEGVGSFWRLDRWVDGERAKAAAKKH